MAAQEVQMSLSNTHPLCHLITVCLALLHSILYGEIYAMFSKNGRKFLFSFSPAHRDTHKDKSSSRVVVGGALQWISAFTRVIASLLPRLGVLIQLDQVCSSMHDLERCVFFFICTRDCAASAELHLGALHLSCS